MAKAVKPMSDALHRAFIERSGSTKKYCVS